MEFANEEERAALKKQRQIRRAMSKGMSPLEIKSKYGSITTEEAHTANTGREKNQSDPVKKFLAANAIIAGTVLTAGALGGAFAVSIQFFTQFFVFALFRRRQASDTLSSYMSRLLGQCPFQPC